MVFSHFKSHDYTIQNISFETDKPRSAVGVAAMPVFVKMIVVRMVTRMGDRFAFATTTGNAHYSTSISVIRSSLPPVSRH